MAASAGMVGKREALEGAGPRASATVGRARAFLTFDEGGGHHAEKTALRGGGKD